MGNHGNSPVTEHLKEERKAVKEVKWKMQSTSLEVKQKNIFQIV